MDYRLLPVVSLLCNLVVVSGGTLRFARAGIPPWRGALGLPAIAAPAALLGGLTPIREQAFMALLGASLCLAGALLQVEYRGDAETDEQYRPDQDLDGYRQLLVLP